MHTNIHTDTHTFKHSFGLFLSIQAWICSNSIQCINHLCPDPDSTWCSSLAQFHRASQSKREWKGKPTYGVRRPLTLWASALRVMKYLLRMLKQTVHVSSIFLSGISGTSHHIGHNSIRFSSGDHKMHTYSLWTALNNNNLLRYEINT